jgi:hypothetical protein
MPNETSIAKAHEAGVKLMTAAENTLRQFHEPMWMLSIGTVMKNINNEELKSYLTLVMSGVTVAKSAALIFMSKAMIASGKMQDDVELASYIIDLRNSIQELIDEMQKAWDKTKES